MACSNIRLPVYDESIAKGAPANVISWLMNMFRPIVEALLLLMLHRWQQFLFGCPIAGQRICDQYAWHVLTSLEPFPKELLSRSLVTPTLYQNVQHSAILIDRTPESDVCRLSSGTPHRDAMCRQFGHGDDVPDVRRVGQTSDTIDGSFHGATTCREQP